MKNKTASDIDKNLTMFGGISPMDIDKNLTISEENYFSPIMNQRYFSVSQFKSFMKCEAATMAEITGEYRREPTDSQLVGSYVDAWMSCDLDGFILDHPEVVKRDGTLKAQFNRADEIINRINRDEVFMDYLDGEHQVIMTAELFGYPWKIKIDSYKPGKVITDLKVMKDFDTVYVPGEGRLSWIDAWGYDIQGAVYQRIEQIVSGRDKPLPFVLAAVTKEKTPDIELIQLPQYKLDSALKIVEHNIDRFAEVKEGLTIPKRCGKCDYCKATKKITGPVIWEEEVE